MRAPFAILMLFVLPGLAAGDDAAARDKQEKQAKQDKAKEDKDRPKPGPAKVYTDEDLKKARENPSSHVTVLGSPDAPPPSSTSTEAQPSAEARPSAESSGGASDQPADEATWKVLAKERWQALRGAEKRIRELEARIQDLMLDRNPNPSDLLDPNRMQKREAAKAEAQQQLEETRGQLAAAQQELEALQTKARNAGVPQSWIEEPPPEPEQQH